MLIDITNELYQMKPAAFGEWLSREGMRWDKGEIDLRRYSLDSVKRLQALILTLGTKGTRNALRDLRVWIDAAQNDLETVKCQTAKDFKALTYELIKKQDRPWLFEKDDTREVWRAYYVSDIKWHPKVVHSDGSVSPAYTVVNLVDRSLGDLQERTLTFHDRDVRKKTPVEVLAERGFVLNTAELYASYREILERYLECYNKVGTQFLARGFATDDLDGNTRKIKNDEDRWRSYSTHTIAMEKNGEPSRVVIDVRYESEKKTPRESVKINHEFWNQQSMLKSKAKDVVLTEEQIENEEAEAEEFEIPVYPIVPVFDLKRHMRLRIHVVDLTLYVYNRELGKKLILPQDTNDLIALLVNNSNDFSDVVKNKGGGSVILCSGPPGCGKTLTAEVYSEVMEKPLYSVQCSQLGTDEEELEDELLKVFARSQRWGSILILDEADVYIRARGTDLKQNAIVGVFLRVLEYYGGVMFLTTNRSDIVDDAISSRCLARIDYALPTPEDQAKIWRVLSEGCPITISDGVIAEIVEKWPKMSGRDVKQLIKLASRVLVSRGQSELTLEDVTFVKRFKPTPGDGQAARKILETP